MARLVCPNTGITVDVPSAEAAAKLMAAGYKPLEQPKPKPAPRRRTAKAKTQEG